MKILKNNTDLDFNKIIDIEKRENNTKRTFLLVNKYQAKHYPISPRLARDMFSRLANEVKKEVSDTDRITFVGFSETATAIGASVAEEFGENSLYVTTTREDIDTKYNVINFSEEHSHATNQAVFCIDANKFFKKCDVLVFVEDEVTTGKTILNFIEAFKKSGYIGNQKIIVSSILNNMEDENVDKFIQLGIKLVYLAKVVNDFEKEVENFEIDRKRLIKRDEQNGQVLYDDNECFDMVELKGRVEPRLGVESSEYKSACVKLAKEILKKDFDGKKILVLGTQECMYPAILVAEELEKKYQDKIIRTHSTSRSPILPVNALYNRNELESLYEMGRTTYIYNLEKYDHVLIITDVVNINNNGVFTLLEALREYDNKDILLVRWI